MEENKGFFLPILKDAGMSEDDLKVWEKVDNAFEEKMKEYSDLTKKFFEEKASPEDIVKSLEEMQKSLSEIEKNQKDFVDKDAFGLIVKDINDNLVRFKSATSVSKSGKLEVKSVEDQVCERLTEYITIDKATGVKRVDLKEACKKSPGNKLNLDLIFTKSFMTTGGENLAGITVDPTIGIYPRPESKLRQYANVASISTRSVVVAELNSTGEARWVPEGELKPEMSGVLSERTITAGKVALFAKVSEEAMYDIPQLVAEIRLEIANRIDQRETDGILYGTGINGEIEGVISDIPDFSLTGISVASPNNFDALVAAYTQISSVSEMNYTPNVALVNPIDYANMTLTKDANGQYITPYRSNGSEMIPGLRVEPDLSMELDNFLVGDFRYLNIRDYMGYTLTFGWENDDFTRNMVTMVGEKRLLAYIKGNHLLAFVKGEFSTVKAAIEKV